MISIIRIKSPTNTPAATNRKTPFQKEKHPSYSIDFNEILPNILCIPSVAGDDEGSEHCFSLKNDL